MTEYKIKFTDQLSKKIKKNIIVDIDDGESNRYDMSIRCYHSALCLAAELIQYPDMKEHITNLIHRIKEKYGEENNAIWIKVCRNLTEYCVDKRMERYTKHLPACHNELKKNMIRDVMDNLHVIYENGCSDLIADYTI